MHSHHIGRVHGQPLGHSTLVGHLDGGEAGVSFVIAVEFGVVADLACALTTDEVDGVVEVGVILEAEVDPGSPAAIVGYRVA